MKGHDLPTSGDNRHPPSVTIYTTPNCHWCGVAKNYFVENKIAYREFDVSSPGSARREMALMTGGAAVPVIKVGAYAMTGWDEAEFLKLMTGRFKQR
jgi:alkyl hydroperoxide reductase subunit F